MLPKSSIWGEPATWQNSKNMYGISGSTELKTTHAKIATFAANDGTLSAGSSAGKTVINKELDLTICPCGQDSNISPFRKIRMFKNHQDAAVNLNPEQTIYNADVCNWFLYDASGGYMHTWNMDHNNELGGSFRWLPDATFTNNLNGQICPYVYWELKSMLIAVEVIIVDGYNASGTPIYSNPIPLETWKNSYQSKPVADIRLSFLGVQSADSTNITYYSTASQPTDGWGGVAYIGKLYDDIQHYAMYSKSGLFAFDVFGHLQGNWYASSNMFVLNSADMFDNTELKSAVNNNDTQAGWCLWWEIPYSAENYDKILSVAALFACPFTPTATRTFATNFTDTDLYLPVIDDNGIAHGVYTHGTSNPNNTLYVLDSVRGKDYDPTADVDENTYNNITGFNSISGGASMTRRYVLDKANVDLLADDLWTISGELATVQGNIDYEHFQAKVIDNFLVTNPIDSIVSIKRFPFDVPHTFSNTKELVKLGKNTATAQGYATYNVFNTVQFAGVNIYKRFGGCFLDFEPYTSYEVYVPFCGTTSLKAADIVGHTLNIRLQIDLLTGTCTAYIMADSLVIETLTGSCGCDMQITGTDTTYTNSAINGALTNAKNAKADYVGQRYGAYSVSGGMSFLTNPVKYGMSVNSAEYNRAKAEYDLQHIQAPLHSMGTASALTGWYQEFNARLMIYYPEGDAIISTVPPKLADLTSYGHTTGFATVQNKKLNNFAGLTVCSDVDLSGISQATATEKQMIYNALIGGVYI